MDSSELSSLLGSGSSGSLLNLDSTLQSLMPFIIIFTVVSILLTVLYGWSVYQRWRVNHAIIEIRDMLRDMQVTPTTKTAAPAPTEVGSPSEPASETN